MKGLGIRVKSVFKVSRSDCIGRKELTDYSNEVALDQ